MFSYLYRGKTDITSDTHIEGINTVLPGHYIEIDLNQIEEQEITQQKWWYPSICENINITFNEAKNNLGSIYRKCENAPQKRRACWGNALRGLDSSAIVCTIRHIEPAIPIHTFSYIAKDTPYNEEYWIDLVNDYAGCKSHKVLIQGQDIQDDIFDLISCQGEPFAGASIYAQFKVFEEARKNGVTVILDGQGADELLAGYEGYEINFLESLLDKKKFATFYNYILLLRNRRKYSLQRCFSIFANSL